MEEGIQLSIVTPNGEAASAVCDSVRLNAQDDAHGRNGGGIGIRRGHASAMIALSEGTVTALLEGTVVRKVKIRGGFAAVGNDKVTVITDHAEILE